MISPPLDHKNTNVYNSILPTPPILFIKGTSEDIKPGNISRAFGQGKRSTQTTALCT